ncbi:substrate-binding domain-containing protein [Phototrophicus methaneseepsis]|uniref:Substrate-binding domain-containing protein n=1 Tax=Phototrophicus methaneseepsis TaxID=2710758 RepID=A0A7S8IE17_9CHLR|nr:substrate-binding domain-containing protein [Phototrophicus methaneseepsis]QPC81959.1 substrate-binding domain-containing protein [Phototrophicus methaneseepsis]
MLRKTLILMVTALVLLVGVTAAQEGEPLKIGILTDESGALTVYGYELEYGFKLGLLYAAGIDPADYDSVDDALAAVEIAGRPVEILVRDNGSDPAVAADQARELIESEGAEILVGAPSSGVTLGLQQVALDNEVMLYVAPGASPSITGESFNVNTVRVCRNTIQDSLALATFATEGLGENWVILAADYDFGRASAAAFEATLSAYGVTFVQDTIYAPLETSDFTSYLQEVMNSGADVLLPIWAGDTTVPLYQQLEELGVGDQMAVVGAFNSNDIVAVSDPSTIGSVSWIVYHYTFPQTEANDWLVEKHVAYFPNPLTGETDYPDLFTECSFATAQAIYETVSATEGDTLPEAMIPAVEGLVFEGPKGTYYVRPSDHQALVPMYIARLDNLDDPEYKFLELLSEVSALDTAPPCSLPESMADRCDMDAEFMESIQAGMGDMGQDMESDMSEDMTEEATEESGG